MKHRNNHFAVGYWSRIRAGRATPDQADIDPKALKRLLPFVFLLDAREDGGFIYRLAGTTLCERYGTELRGQDYLNHWDPESRENLSLVLRQALANRTPLCVTSIGATEDCRMVEIETVLMPITFGSEQPERFLAVAQVLTDVAPLVGRSITFERLVSFSVVREEETAWSSTDLPPPPPPPPPPPIFGHRTLRSHPRAPHLRLVVSHCDAAPAPFSSAHQDPLHIDPSATLKKILAFCGIADPHSRYTTGR